MYIKRRQVKEGKAVVYRQGEAEKIFTESIKREHAENGFFQQVFTLCESKHSSVLEKMMSYQVRLAQESCDAIIFPPMCLKQLQEAVALEKSYNVGE